MFQSFIQVYGVFARVHKYRLAFKQICHPATVKHILKFAELDMKTDV